MAVSHLERPADAQRQLHVVVIGAGASGLVAAREAIREGHSVTLLESGTAVGGVWIYSNEVESDATGMKPRRRIHSSMYRDLRTNLPRDCMSYLDFPFAPEGMLNLSHDPRTYPTHAEVLAYLEAFAESHKLRSLIRFHSHVTHVTRLPAHAHRPQTWPRWRVNMQCKQQNGCTTVREEQLDADAVMVCNGHYSEPSLPSIPGMDAFPGQQMHTHNYRSNEAFAGLRVCVIGAQASGIDISLEIAQTAAQVHLCSRHWPEDMPVNDHPILGSTNVFARRAPESIHTDGSITFEDGVQTDNMDVIVYATGYRYSYPFLDASSGVTAQGNRVAPVYKHTLVPQHGPTLSFLGLPFKVAPFPMFEVQARWVMRALSGRIKLPSEEVMVQDIEQHYQQLEERGQPPRYAHMVGEQQWDMIEWLGEQCGMQTPVLPAWRRPLYEASSALRGSAPHAYRDLPLNEELLAEAARDNSRVRKLAEASEQTAFALDGGP